MSTQPDQDQQPLSVRLIYSYDGDDVRLESTQPIEMLAPPGEAVESAESRTGFWTEVRDAQGGVLHQQSLPDPVRRDVEVFSPGSDQSISRVPLDRPRGAFAVLIPMVSGADHVALMGPSTAGAASLAPATELHRASLTGTESS